MATFFGEVLPIYSRAVDEEDYDISFKPPQVCWVSQQSDDVTSKVQSLVIAATSIARGFLDTYCLRNEWVKKAGSFCEADDNSSATFRKDESVFSLYTSTGVERATAFCVPNTSFMNEENIWSYVDKLFEVYDQLHDVVVLDSASIHQYLRDELEVETPVVKSLWTSRYKKSGVFPVLKQPNTVRGLAAAVLAKCEILKIPAILHVCYTDSINLSVSSINSFCPILNQVPFTYHEKTEVSLEKLKSLVSSYGSEHSLYM